MVEEENGGVDPRLQAIKAAIRVVPHFPKPGSFLAFLCFCLLSVWFRFRFRVFLFSPFTECLWLIEAGIMFNDITTLLLRPKVFKDAVEIFVDRYRDMNISADLNTTAKEQGLQFRHLPPVYIPVRQVAGTWIVCYRAVSPKIDCRRSIEGEINHRRSIEREKGKKKKRKKKKTKKKRGEKEYLSPARGPRSCAIAVRESRALFLPRGEKDRGDHVDNCSTFQIVPTGMGSTYRSARYRVIPPIGAVSAPLPPEIDW
ncbi:hypothetical protein GW17_00039838 [Ensete ventricosum]|nr:hypothetical protein GW17_00039838 [Ensete ventricosum]